MSDKTVDETAQNNEDLTFNSFAAVMSDPDVGGRETTIRLLGELLHIANQLAISVGVTLEDIAYQGIDRKYVVTEEN